MKKPRIRKATRNDARRLAGVESECWIQPLQYEQLRQIGDLCTHGFVAIENRQIVGHIIFKCGTRPCSKTGRTKNYTAIISLTVLPEHQRNGVGSRLLRQAVEFGATKGHQIVVCAVCQANWMAQEFFSRHDFRVTKTLNEHINSHGQVGCYVFEFNPDRPQLTVDLNNRFSNAQA